MSVSVCVCKCVCMTASDDYEWELVVAQPEKHSNHPSARRRAYYVGARMSAG